MNNKLLDESLKSIEFYRHNLYESINKMPIFYGELGRQEMIKQYTDIKQYADMAIKYLLEYKTNNK